MFTSSSIWLWYREAGQNGSNGTIGKWAIKKVIEIPAEPADPEKLPPILQGFKAVAPLVTDINLSLDDRYLYVSCWGTGELIQSDVSAPFNPKEFDNGAAIETGHDMLCCQTQPTRTSTL